MLKEGKEQISLGTEGLYKAVKQMKDWLVSTENYQL